MSRVLEKNYRLKEAQSSIGDIGEIITFNRYKESPNILRNDKNHIINRDNPDPFYIYAHPIIFSPDERRLSTMGVRNIADVVLTIPYKTFLDNSLTFDDIDVLRWVMIVQEVPYRIDQVVPVQKYLDVYTKANVTGVRV